MMQVQPEGENPHGHYFKNVRNLAEIDVYRVIRLFGVTDPALAHAVKKLLVAGGRGAGKSQEQDVKEAIISCKRFLEMNVEDVSDASTGAVTVTNIVHVPDCSSAELARRIGMKDLRAKIFRNTENFSSDVKPGYPEQIVQGAKDFAASELRCGNVPTQLLRNLFPDPKERQAFVKDHTPKKVAKRRKTR